MVLLCQYPKNYRVFFVCHDAISISGLQLALALATIGIGPARIQGQSNIYCKLLAQFSDNHHHKKQSQDVSVDKRDRKPGGGGKGK